MNDILVARQPIYDIGLNVFAYELLYRSSKENNFYDNSNIDSADASTYRVIVNTFLDIGIDKLTGHKRGFINFTEKILLSGVINILPKDFIGIEILEDVKPTDEVVEACRELKKSGYMIILDDFVLTEETKRFMEIADIVKMDFMASSKEELKNIAKKYKNHSHNHKKRGIKFLAEKIETLEDFELAKEWGYSYFQGYYFHKPTIVSHKSMKPLYSNVIKIIEMLNKEDCDMREIAEFMEYDPAIIFKILRLANSVIYGGTYAYSEITNIKMALSRIGIKDLKICMMLVLTNGLDKNKPNELIRRSVLRAKMAEDIAIKLRRPELGDTFSLMGLISLMDVMLDIPLKDMLNSLNVSNDIEKALLSPSNNIYSHTIRLIVSFENANWKSVNYYLKKLNMPIKDLSEISFSAIKWCDEHYHYI